jgi:phospholipid transport system substrate-binding protein
LLPVFPRAPRSLPASEHDSGILHDPAFQGETKTRERCAAIRQVAASLFDFGEMARRALGRHWRARTPAERAEFTELFADLLERAYIARIEEYRGEPIRYRQGKIEGDRVTVHTMILTKGGAEVPVDYRMHREGDRWLVYDVLIEGISLVANYRTQFNRIIQTSSWDELVERMRAKTAGAAA